MSYDKLLCGERNALTFSYYRRRVSTLRLVLYVVIERKYWLFGVENLCSSNGFEPGNEIIYKKFMRGCLEDDNDAHLEMTGPVLS